MKGLRRRPLGGLFTALFTAVAVAFMVTALLTSPARAQTTGGSSSTNYPIPPSSGTAPQVSTSTVPPTTATSKLAFTGADIAGLMVVAAVVIGGGGALVLISRKRKAEQ